MPEEIITTGVEQGSAAEVQTESDFDLESLLFGDLEPGVETEGAADPNTEQNTASDTLPEDASKAFAAKLADEREKMRRELKDELLTEISQDRKEPAVAPAQNQPVFKDYTDAQIDEIAEQYDTSPVMVRKMLEQEKLTHMLYAEQRRNAQVIKEQTEYRDAKAYAEQTVQRNSSIPAWDDKAVDRYRQDHWKNTGVVLPWKEAYRLIIADAVLNGDVKRKTQQETITNITKRSEETNTLQQTATRKRSVEDLSKDEFEKLVAEAKTGRYQKK